MCIKIELCAVPRDPRVTRSTAIVHKSNFYSAVMETYPRVGVMSSNCLPADFGFWKRRGPKAPWAPRVAPKRAGTAAGGARAFCGSTHASEEVCPFYVIVNALVRVGNIPFERTAGDRYYLSDDTHAQIMGAL